jgi:protein ImuB
MNYYKENKKEKRDDMQKRFLSIWFRRLKTDWFTIRQPEVKNQPFVTATPDHGRMLITAANRLAESQGIRAGMPLADARAICPSLKFVDDQPGLSGKLLQAIAWWCIRFTPFAAVDLPDGIMIDATGCAHLWGGEDIYLLKIEKRLKDFGYDVRISIADSIGCAWAMARYGKKQIVASGDQFNSLLPLDPAALRLGEIVVERLQKLGLRQIKDFISMPRPALRRRFGNDLLNRIDQALGNIEELLQYVHLPEAWLERLPCLEPIVTLTGIEIALKKLLEALCQRLVKEQRGIRKACFKAYRIDGKIEKIAAGTSHASYSAGHLFKLFEQKIETIEPALGIELFTLEALQVDDVVSKQEKIWETSFGLENIKLSELIDRLVNKIGANAIHRYLPAEHHWPERSIELASSVHEKINEGWRREKPRPIQLLVKPEQIQVTAPIPDYPPMLFRYQNKLHKIKKADGPERIEREWWLEEGPHRDYYTVEDEEGHRYWLFRSGHYGAGEKWFIHGFFA